MVSQVSEPPLNRKKEAMSTDPQPVPTDSAKKEAGRTEETEDRKASLCYSSERLWCSTLSSVFNWVFCYNFCKSAPCFSKFVVILGQSN